MNHQISNVSVEDAPPIAVEFHRGNALESVHRAYVCLADSSGRVIYHQGDPEHRAILRSSAKPLQALEVVVSGAADRFGFTAEELAIMAGSHNGTDRHVQVVQSILAKIGLSVANLQCGVQLPLDKTVASQLRDSGREPTPMHHNCSGKHAGMLAVQVHFEESVEDYLSPDAAAQRGICRNISRLSGEPADGLIVGRDGCSAPVHIMPMRAAALAYARLVDPDCMEAPPLSPPGTGGERFGVKPGTGGEKLDTALVQAANRIVQAMQQYPQMIAGEQGRICTPLIREGGQVRLIAKAGAEGYYAAAWIDPETRRGLGLCVKVEDGSERARNPVVLALLQKFGVLPQDLPQTLAQFGDRTIRNFRGLEVGEIKVRA